MHSSNHFLVFQFRNGRRRLFRFRHGHRSHFYNFFLFGRLFDISGSFGGFLLGWLLLRWLDCSLIFHHFFYFRFWVFVFRVRLLCRVFFKDFRNHLLSLLRHLLRCSCLHFFLWCCLSRIFCRSAHFLFTLRHLLLYLRSRSHHFFLWRCLSRTLKRSGHFLFLLRHLVFLFSSRSLHDFLLWCCLNRSL